MALAEKLQDPQLEEIGWWAWDALDLAESGQIQESREQVIDQMSAALNKAATHAAAAWSVWPGVLNTGSALQRPRPDLET